MTRPATRLFAEFPRNQDATAPDHYFLPPVVKNYPPAARLGTHSPAFRAMHWTWLGKTVTVNMVTYQGGRWAGPLSDAEITAIQDAGYGGRIRAAWDVALLPAGID